MGESSIITFSIFTIIFLGIVLSFIWFVNKIRQQKKDDKRAMAQFQREMEREFVPKERVSQSSDVKSHVESGFPSQKENAPIIQPTASDPALPMVFSSSSQPAVTPQSQTITPSEQVIMRLKEANLFESSEGPYFPIDPSGECVLIRLKQNKTALLVPRFESQYFIQNALKRFDYVFLILSKDKVLVVNSFSGFIAGHFKL